MTGRVFSINIGKKKGKPKEMVVSCVLKDGYGIEGDVHAGYHNRQVSLLSVEAIEEMEKDSSFSGLDLRPGLFAENITTEGIDLSQLKIGDRLAIADKAVLEITEIGKKCHNGCSIMQSVGKCIMPKQGIFASVISGGPVKMYDRITLEKKARPWLKI